MSKELVDLGQLLDQREKCKEERVNPNETSCTDTQAGWEMLFAGHLLQKECGVYVLLY